MSFIVEKSRRVVVEDIAFKRRGGILDARGWLAAVLLVDDCFLRV